MKFNNYRGLICLLFLICLTANSRAQLYQGFEGIISSLDCGNSSCYYVDPDSPTEPHFLADHGNVAVHMVGEGDILGFITEFHPTRSGASGADGLADGDAFGVAGSTQFESENADLPPEGDHAFLMQDTDGLATLYFDYVDLKGSSTPQMNLKYFLSETTWESSSSQNDRFYVRLEIDKCASSSTITLIDTDGGGTMGNTGGDIDDLQIEGIWNTLNADLSPYIGCRVQLIIEFDSNASAETLGIDQIIFTEGNRQSFNPTATETEEDMIPSLERISLVNTKTGLEITPLTDGQLVDISELPSLELSIEAETSEYTESVYMEISGEIRSHRIENEAPFTLFGNRGNNFFSRTFRPGTYVLRLIPYTKDNGEGNKGKTIELEFQIIGFQQTSVFKLIDSSDDSELIEISDGTIVDKKLLGDLLFGISFAPIKPVKGVELRLSGPVSHRRFEGSVPPYSLFGDLGTDIQGRKLLPGHYTLMAKPRNGEAVSLRFSVVDSALAITSYLLVDADSNTDIATLIDGSVIDQSTLPTQNLNIRANATSEVESVRLMLSGTASHGMTENFAPFALFGDISGDYKAGVFPVGSYTLMATPFSGNGLRGTEGTAMTINFTVIAGAGGTLKLYPNPAVTELQVKVVDSKKVAEIFTIQVRDMQGRLIGTYFSKNIAGNNHFSMPTNTMRSGLYHMTVIGSQGTVHKKSFVVNK